MSIKTKKKRKKGREERKGGRQEGRKKGGREGGKLTWNLKLDRGALYCRHQTLNPGLFKLHIFI
jgi:hypothetical protein